MEHKCHVIILHPYIKAKQGTENKILEFRIAFIVNIGSINNLLSSCSGDGKIKKDLNIITHEVVWD